VAGVDRTPGLAAVENLLKSERGPSGNTTRIHLRMTGGGIGWPVVQPRIGDTYIRTSWALLLVAGGCVTFPEGNVAGVGCVVIFLLIEICTQTTN
jgi:hypothetical protein